MPQRSLNFILRHAKQIDSYKDNTQFPFVKNPGFKEENEWRAVVCSGIGHYNGYYDGIEEGYNSQTPVNIQKSDTTYR